ncbi:MAG: preprotein translocase subunit SecG [Planctomycetaceae bacterium]|nr:preprotein translocase subunit SecG [Planctomycetaceae bacterium]
MSWWPYITMFLLMMVGLMLIFIILLQRGRGGGLAGALGGMGGQSAFGTKAGDVFTRITIVLATVWMVLAAGNVFALRYTGTKYTGGSDAVSTAPSIEADGKEKADDDKEMADILKGITDKKDAEEKPATSETTTTEEKKPADPAAPAEKAPEKPADETKPVPTEEKKPAEEKPAEKAATPEEAPKTEKPAEPEAKDEKKPE